MASQLQLHSTSMHVCHTCISPADMFELVATDLQTHLFFVVAEPAGISVTLVLDPQICTYVHIMPNQQAGTHNCTRP